MFEKLLTLQEGCYQWKSDNFSGYTQHQAGRITWASAIGTSHQYYGLEAILRIASNPTITVTKTEDLNMPPNVEGDWESNKAEILRQIERGRRFHARKANIENLWIKVLNIPPDMEDGPAKELLLSMPKRTCALKSLKLEHPELGLWLFIDMEIRQIVEIFEPTRVEVPKDQTPA